MPPISAPYISSCLSNGVAKDSTADRRLQSFLSPLISEKGRWKITPKLRCCGLGSGGRTEGEHATVGPVIKHQSLHLLERYDFEEIVGVISGGFLPEPRIGSLEIVTNSSPKRKEMVYPLSFDAIPRSLGQ